MFREVQHWAKEHRCGGPIVPLRIESWNINYLTRNQQQKGREIFNRLKRSAILALQETHLQSHLDFEFDEGRISTWRYDREPVKCNRDGGGLMVFFRNDLITLRLAGMRQLPDVTMERENPPTIKAGLQYMHFKLTRPIEIDLVTIYHSSGEYQHVIDLVRFFRNVLNIRNILFVGDFNVRPEWLNPILGRNRFTLHINGLTSYTNPENPSQTDHMISDLRPPGVNVDADIEPVQLELSDHCVIWCGIRIETPPTKPQIPVFQPLWDLNEAVKNINECRWRLLVFYSTFSKHPTSKTIQSDVMLVYTSNSEAELIYIQENNHPNRLDEYRERVVHLRRCRPCPISLRCTVICSTLPDQKFKEKVQNATGGNLSGDFERFASRSDMCDEPNVQDGCDKKIFRTEADKTSHAIQMHGLEPFKCLRNVQRGTCGQEFDREQLYWKHLVKVHDVRRYSECRFEDCDEFLDNDDVIRHSLLVHHKFVCSLGNCLGFNRSHRPELHKCKEKGCKTVCDTQKDFVQHSKREHKKVIRWFSKCPKCQRDYKKYKWFKKHLDRCLFDKDKRYRCENCNRCFETKPWCDKHKKLCHTAKEFVCANCGKAFKGENWLANHVEHCGSIQPYMCRRCGHKFATEGRYNTHVKKCRK